MCVLAESAKINLFGYTPAIGSFVKVNDNWLEVIGVLGEQIAASALDVAWVTRTCFWIESS